MAASVAYASPSPSCSVSTAGRHSVSEPDQSLPKWELVEIGIARADPSDSMLAHQNSSMRIVQQIACEMWQFDEDLRGHIGVALRGCRITRGWVVTRKNSYRIDQVVYQASGRDRWRSSQPRHGRWNYESASAAYTRTLVSTASTIDLPWLGRGHHGPRHRPAYRRCGMSEAGGSVDAFAANAAAAVAPFRPDPTLYDPGAPPHA